MNPAGAHRLARLGLTGGLELGHLLPDRLESISRVTDPYRECGDHGCDLVVRSVVIGGAHRDGDQ